MLFRSNIIKYFDVAEKYEIIKKYIHPINYKSIPWKLQTPDNKDTPSSSNNSTDTSKKIILQKNRIIEDYMIIETSNMLDCFDLARTSKSFQTKVYGIKVSIPDYNNKQTIIISGVVDDILLECMNYKFITKKKKKNWITINLTIQNFIVNLGIDLF